MGGRVHPDDVAAIRERVAIEQVIGEVVTLKAAGPGSLNGLCPFHEERSPSFRVSPAPGLYHCFGCLEGGDVFDFLMKHDHLTFVEAVEKLAPRAGVSLRHVDGGQPQRHGPKRTRLVAANRAAADFFTAALTSPEASVGRQFLDDRRFGAEAQARFGVGYAPGSWDALLGQLRSRGFSDAEILAAGLVSQGKRGPIDRFRGRLVWPIRDAAGDVLGFGARKLTEDDDSPKYLNTPETALYKKSHVLYGLDLARRDIAKRKQVVVVEGYTDVMAAHLAGVTTAVATCGTAFGADHASLLRRLLSDVDAFGGEVIFTFDGDAAGQKAALRAFEGDQRFVAQTFIAVSPDDMDPCELRLARGDEAVRELVAGRTPLFAFAIRSTLAGFDLKTAEGRVAALRLAAPVVARIRDTSLRPEYTRLLAGWVGMPESEVRSEVTKAGRAKPDQGRGDHRGADRGATQPDHRPPGHGPGAAEGTASPGAPPGRAPRPNPQDRQLSVERDSLKCVVQYPQLVGEWFDRVVAGCYLHPRYEEVRQAVAAVGGTQERVGGRAWIDDVLAACADDVVRELVRELAVEPLKVAGEPDTRYATSIVAKLLMDEVDRRIADLLRELGRLDPDTHADQVTAILADIVQLEAYRRSLAQVGRDQP